MSNVTLVYTGPHDEVEIGATGAVCARGGTVEVPGEIAGSAPTGEPGTDGYDAGEGLLAQSDNWQPATRAAKAPAAKPETEQE